MNIRHLLLLFVFCAAGAMICASENTCTTCTVQQPFLPVVLIWSKAAELGPVRAGLPGICDTTLGRALDSNVPVVLPTAVLYQYLYYRPYKLTDGSGCCELEDPARWHVFVDNHEDFALCIPHAFVPLEHYGFNKSSVHEIAPSRVRLYFNDHRFIHKGPPAVEHFLGLFDPSVQNPKCFYVIGHGYEKTQIIAMDPANYQAFLTGLGRINTVLLAKVSCFSGGLNEVRMHNGLPHQYSSFSCDQINFPIFTCCLTDNEGQIMAAKTSTFNRFFAAVKELVVQKKIMPSSFGWQQVAPAICHELYELEPIINNYPSVFIPQALQIQRFGSHDVHVIDHAALQEFGNGPVLIRPEVACAIIQEPIIQKTIRCTGSKLCSIFSGVPGPAHHFISAIEASEMNFEQLMKVFRGSSAGIPGSFYEEYVGCSPKAWFIGTVICRDKTVQHVVVYREKDVCKQDRFWYRCADAFCASVAQQATRPREGALRFATDGRVSTKDLALAYRAFLANASLGPSWFGKACSGMWRLVTWSEDTVAEYKKAKDLTAAEVMPLFCEPRSWDGSPKETAKCAFLRSCRSPEALLACLRQIANKDLVWDYINIATRNRCFGQPVWERLLAPYADNADVLYVAAINGCPANLMPQYVPVVQAAATATGRYQAWDRLSVLPSALTLESVTKLFATHDTYAMFNTGGCNAPDRFAPLFPLLRANRLSDALGLVHVLNNEQKSACLGSCKRWFASDVFTAVLGHLSHEHRSGNALSRNDASLLVPAIVGMARNATHEYAARAALDALLLLVDTGHRELVASDPTLTGSLQALAQIYPQEPVAQELLRVITHKDK